MIRRYCILTMGVLCIFLSGCYDSAEIDSLACAVAVGIEKNGDDCIRYTFVIADTSEFSPGGGNAENSRICFGSCADGVDAAIKETEGKIGKKLSLSHMALLLFSDECSENDIANAAEYFGSSSKVRPQTLAAAASFSPEKYFNEFSSVVKVNAEKYFYAVFKNELSEKALITVGDCIDAVRCEESIRLPFLSLSRENELFLNGTLNLNFKSKGRYGDI